MKTSFTKIITTIFIVLAIMVANCHLNAQNDFTQIKIDANITHVQPMTGIVFWNGQHQDVGKEATSLEFSYMLFNDVVSDSGVYNWDAVEEKLNSIASRQHQAIFRFRYVYPGYETSVPDYIKQRDDYHETKGTTEGKTTWFPDWTNAELQRFTLAFYSKFAQRYDNDPRIAFLEVGFGLWAEYHIYDGPFILGVTFPSKEFQESFFYHMDTTFVKTPFMISIDAADDTYSPFKEKPELLQIHFGNFDDSFMHQGFDTPGEYNTESWKFFGDDRYKTSPHGGEFSYYTNYDQKHVLDWPDGPYGKPYEYFTAKYHITFIIGNDQPEYQTKERIKKASMASGYKFKIVSFLSKPDSSVVTVKNVGVAPIYYDAYISVDGVRSPVSLKLLVPGDSIVCPVAAGGNDPQLTIESDRLVEGQTIEYLGTENYVGIKEKNKETGFLIFPNPVRENGSIHLKNETDKSKQVQVRIFDLTGQIRYSGSFKKEMAVDLSNLSSGLYLVSVNNGKRVTTKKLLVE